MTTAQDRKQLISLVTRLKPGSRKLTHAIKAINRLSTSHECLFDLVDRNGTGCYQEGDRVRIFGKGESLITVGLTIDAYLVFQAGASYFYYYGGTLHPTAEPAQPAMQFELAGLAKTALLLVDLGLPDPAPPQEFIVWALFTRRATFIPIAPLTRLDLAMLPGASSCTGVLGGSGTIESPTGTIDPDGGNPVQGYNHTLLPLDHWTANQVWYLKNQDHGVFNSHTANGCPALVVRLRSGYFDVNGLDESVWMNDCWFHIRVMLPAGYRLQHLTLILSMTQLGIGNFYISSYKTHDWNFFRPVYRLLTAGGQELIPWKRVTGSALDEFSFIFTIPTIQSHTQQRYLDIAQCPSYPPSRARQIPQVLTQLFTDLGITLAQQTIGYGGLSSISIAPDYRESNPLQALWVYKDTGDLLAKKPVILVSAGIHLEPIGCFVAEGMLRSLCEDSSLLDEASLLFFLHMNPDAQHWGITEVFPADGRNAQNWWQEGHPSLESRALQNYFNQLLEAKFQLHTYLDLHCDVAPRDHRPARMPICGGFEVASEAAEAEVANFINFLGNDQQFGSFFRRFPEGWCPGGATQLVLPPMAGYGFRHRIIIEFDEIAFYREVLNQDQGYEYVVDHYIEEEPELFQLGALVMQALKATLLPDS